MSEQEVAQAVRHTPGPWEVDDIDPRRINESGTGDMVAWVGADTEHPLGEKLANARLIAKAPALEREKAQLLAALEAIRDHPVRLATMTEMTQAINGMKGIASRAAIRAVKGQG